VSAVRLQDSLENSCVTVPTIAFLVTLVTTFPYVNMDSLVTLVTFSCLRAVGALITLLPLVIMFALVTMVTLVAMLTFVNSSAIFAWVTVITNLKGLPCLSFLHGLPWSSCMPSL
jgi:hypothetical protein